MPYMRAVSAWPSSCATTEANTAAMKATPTTAAISVPAPV
jgi:hypothetical protein